MNSADSALLKRKTAAGQGSNPSIEYCRNGDKLLAQLRFKEALAQYNLALEHNAESLDAYIGCGRALSGLKQHDYAIAHLDHAITSHPNSAAAHHFRGIALQKARQYPEAISAFQKAIELKPDDMASYLNLANTLADADYHQEALDFYNAVIEHSPSALAYNNRGNLYLDCQYTAKALADYDSAIALQPGEMKFLWNKALLKLLLGDFDEGWQLYEHGFKTAGYARGEKRQCAQPLWLGETDVRGKRLLIAAEQGYGDIIQFSRYALLLLKQGAHVILEVPKPLLGLAQTLHPDISIIEQGAPYSDFECYCPVMSLPLAFQTRVETIPAQVPYLKADASLIGKFRLPQKNKLRVGLVWSGSTTHNNDHRRSIPLQLLAPLAAAPVEWHCLQKEIRPADEAALAAMQNLKVHVDALGDFNDTAALIDAMDLVISVDTAVVHLAGALGKPVWVLLPFMPDFRWLLEREDSPWYPTAKLYRQPAIGDWPSVIARLQSDLISHANTFNSDIPLA